MFTLATHWVICYQKFLRCIAHVINPLLTECYIFIMSRIACELTHYSPCKFMFAMRSVVEPCNLAGCVIYMGHVSYRILSLISSTQPLVESNTHAY